MRNETGTIEAGTFRLGYRIEGDGIPTVVIGSATYYPRVFSSRLRDHLRFVFLDHRGFAPVPDDVGAESFELGTILDDVERARNELGLGPVAVVGHSGHAFMALEYAKKYPANVTNVVMIGIAPDLSPASLAAAQRNWNESASSERKAVMEENLRRFPEERLAELPVGPRFVQTYLRNGPLLWCDPTFDSAPFWANVEPNQVLEHIWGQVFPTIDISRGLDSFDRPVWLGLGRYDFVVAPPSSWDSLRSRFKDLTVRVFERSGHTPQYEEADAFDSALLEWMR